MCLSSYLRNANLLAGQVEPAPALFEQADNVAHPHLVGQAGPRLAQQPVWGHALTVARVGGAEYK